jgi:hypothetical protein
MFYITYSAWPSTLNGDSAATTSTTIHTPVLTFNFKLPSPQSASRLSNQLSHVLKGWVLYSWYNVTKLHNSCRLAEFF